MKISSFLGFILNIALITGCDIKENKTGFMDENQDKISDSNLNRGSSSKNPKNLIRIKDMKFIPDKLEIKKGDTVYWINDDVFVHNVVESTSESWSSPELKKGEMWNMVFTDEEEYHCSLHKIMVGKLTVTNP